MDTGTMLGFGRTTELEEEFCSSGLGDVLKKVKRAQLLCLVVEAASLELLLQHPAAHPREAVKVRMQIRQALVTGLRCKLAHPAGPQARIISLEMLVSSAWTSVKQACPTMSV